MSSHKVTSSAPVLGVDFGTCNTSAALFVDGAIHRVPAAACQEHYNFPTVACITEQGDIKVCHEARSMAASSPSRFFRKFKLQLENDQPLLPGMRLRREDLVSAILAKVKTEAERFLGGASIERARITLPVVFGQAHPARRVMERAATRSGFKQVEFLYEPESAALYYGYKLGLENAKPGSVTLVYDLGGGTFDPALIRMTPKGWELVPVIAPGVACGGVYFDRLVRDDFRNKLPQCWPANATVGQEHAYKLLYLIDEFCEKAKVALSDSECFSEPVPFLPEIEYTITRAEFYKMIDPLLGQTLDCCDLLLKKAGFRWDDISRVLLVGGSCNIPYIRKRIQQHLSTVSAKMPPVSWSTVMGKTIHPEHAVSMGAAVPYAAFDTTNDITMNSEIYEAKRNELIELLDRVLAIEELKPATKEEIRMVRRKSLENSFEIVLIGEFQGGKSTTFNAVCDGREISPRGAMIKTSACKISACNISDPEVAEYADITWKTDQELMLSMIKLIEPYLRRTVPERFGEATTDQIIGRVELQELMTRNSQFGPQNSGTCPLDLKSASDLKLINEALASEWKVYNQDRRTYGKAKLDSLRIATLVTHFVGSQTVGALRAKTRLDVYEMGKLVSFPMDWDNRWEKCSAEAFVAEEIAFAYIARVECYIHSPNLARLGCIITDCPGLFASPWDTEVAQQAMLNADAILYLLGGEKTLDQGDEEALSHIRAVNMEHKLVFAINAKGNLNNIRTVIRPANVAKLRAQGLDIEDSDIHIYHALLGLCARNGPRIMSKLLDGYSMERFVKVARTIDPSHGNTPEQVWAEICEDKLRSIIRTERVDGLDEANIEKVTRYSGIDELLGIVETTVVTQKSYSVLVAQGAERAANALAQLEGEMVSSEEIAGKTEADFRRAVVKAREDLEVFQREARKLVKKIESDTLPFALAENYENTVIMQNISRVADVATERIVQNLLSFERVTATIVKTVISKVTGKQDTGFEAALKPIFESSISDVCGPASKGWIENVKTGKNQIYNTTIAVAVEEVAQGIESAWNKATLSRTSQMMLLEGLQVESPAGSIVDKESVLKRINTKDLETNIRGAGGYIIAGGILGVSVGGLAGGVAFAVTCYICLSIGLVFLPIIIPAVIALVAAVASGKAIGEALQSAAGRQVRKKVAEGLQSAFHDPVAKEKLRKNSLDLVSAFQAIYITYFQQALKQQEQDFESRVAARKKDFDNTEAYRRDLAKRLNALRVDKVEPSRKMIEKFKASVLSELGRGVK